MFIIIAKYPDHSRDDRFIVAANNSDETVRKAIFEINDNDQDVRNIVYHPTQGRGHYYLPLDNITVNFTVKSINVVK